MWGGFAIAQTLVHLPYVREALERLFELHDRRMSCARPTSAEFNRHEPAAVASRVGREPTFTEMEARSKPVLERFNGTVRTRS